jgi:hypothetical protein
MKVVVGCSYRTAETLYYEPIVWRRVLRMVKKCMAAPVELIGGHLILPCMVCDMCHRCVRRNVLISLKFVRPLKPISLCSCPRFTWTLLSISLTQSKMGSPEHLRSRSLERGKEASMFFGGGSGRTSGHDVCAFPICWGWKLVWFLFAVIWFLFAVPEIVGRGLSFSFRKGLVVCLVS